jgi:5-(carboxyamino)imidazole ribonucleotide synthase
MKVGILGAGQLARMLALAGFPLGVEFIFLDPSADACANKLGTHLHGEYNDPQLLAELAERADVVTYEFENVPADVAAFLTAHTTVYPPAQALAVGQDRIFEKNFFRQLGIPTAAYAEVNSLDDLQRVMDEIGYPAIIKSRTQGYDGKGQSVLKSPDDLVAAWQLLEGVPSIVEAFVPFTREVSIIAVRSPVGELVFYPLSENYHRGGILRIAECKTNDPLQAKAEEYVTKLMTTLDYVGVLALELFDVDGHLVANEFAPRVHNSGHWTIEGAATSQFENHLRAILNLPLGVTQAVGKTAMVNFIGGLPTTTEVLAIANAHLHLYDKAPRQGRKVAHATALTDTEEALKQTIKQLHDLAEKTNDS